MEAPWTTRSRFEVWLGSAWRRMLLVGLAVLVLTALSTRIWVEAAEEAGRPLDWGYVFGRRLLDWGVWGLLFEPLRWLLRLTTRWLKPIVLLVLLHIGLSFVVAQGMKEASQALAQSLFEPRPSGTTLDDAPLRRGLRMGRPLGMDMRRGMERGGMGRMGRRPEERHTPDLERFYRTRADLGILAYWTILGLSWGISTYSRQREDLRRALELELRSAKLEKDLGEAKLANLRSQLHPHFVFNTMHSVGGLVRENRGDKALELLANLGSLLRSSMEQGKEHEASLHDELELAEHYLEIERIRFGDRLKLTTRIEPGIGTTRMPSLVLLPLVENAIKYGVAPRTAGGHVQVSAWRSEGRILLEVLDDGPGFPPEVLRGEFPEREGRAPIGLENTRARMQGLYGEAGGMELSNPAGGGARVLLWVEE